MATVSRSGLSDSSLLGLAILNLFLADARDGLGPFLDAFLATRGWSPLTLGAIATVGGLIGLALTPFAGALVDRSALETCADRRPGDRHHRRGAADVAGA